MDTALPKFEALPVLFHWSVQDLWFPLTTQTMLVAICKTQLTEAWFYLLAVGIISKIYSHCPCLWFDEIQSFFLPGKEEYLEGEFKSRSIKHCQESSTTGLKREMFLTSNEST